MSWEIGTLRNIRVKFLPVPLVFSEGYESRMLAYFLNAELGRTNTQGSLTVFDAARVIRNLKRSSPVSGAGRIDQVFGYRGI